MGDIRFTPHFQHTDWADGTDRVRAKDPNGFNTRFATIENDLVQFSAVVAQIDTALDQAANRPTQQQLWLPPQLMPVAGSSPWQTTPSGAVRDIPGTAPVGVMDLVLPDGVRLLTFRAIGNSVTGAEVTFQLDRVPFGRETGQVMATGTNGARVFDIGLDVDPGLAQTSTASFRYIIRASAPATPTSGVNVEIQTFQIVYSTS